MESSGIAGRRGRYEKRAGGQQVLSFFHEATDNEKIKAVYGNYNLWSWLRYWFLDTENHITLMLLDKGYYDYDYENVVVPLRRKETQEQKDRRTQRMMDRFGFGKVKSVKETPTPSDLQAAAMKADQNKRATQ